MGSIFSKSAKSRHNDQERLVAVIPARYRSSRYPGKPLVRLLGKPMILWVAEVAADVLGREHVYVATESEEIFSVVLAAGYQALMTDDSCLTGTDRVWQAAAQIDAQIILNIQGDEPTLAPATIRTVIEAQLQNPGSVHCAMAPISKHEDPTNVNIPKVVVAPDNRLLYMSRSLVPGQKSGCLVPTYDKQVCVYSFPRTELERFGSYLKKTPMESFEDIELLRCLELGIPVRMVTVQAGSVAVDVPDDVAVVERVLREKSG